MFLLVRKRFRRFTGCFSGRGKLGWEGC